MHILHQVLDGRVAGEECSYGTREDRPDKGYADPNNKAFLTPSLEPIIAPQMYVPPTL
jgi:hypothetical protein